MSYILCAPNLMHTRNWQSFLQHFTLMFAHKMHWVQCYEKQLETWIKLCTAVCCKTMTLLDFLIFPSNLLNHPFLESVSDVRIHCLSQLCFETTQCIIYFWSPPPEHDAYISNQTTPEHDKSKLRREPLQILRFTVK